MDFVSDDSHEFKTRLMPLKDIQCCFQEKNCLRIREEYVEKILFNTQRLSGLVGNILLVIQVRESEYTNEKREYRLDEQIRQAVLSLETKWTEKKLFSGRIGGLNILRMKDFYAYLDQSLDNVIKFSPSKGTITMFLKKNRILLSSFWKMKDQE